MVHKAENSIIAVDGEDAEEPTDRQSTESSPLVCVSLSCQPPNIYRGFVRPLMLSMSVGEDQYGLCMEVQVEEKGFTFVIGNSS